MPWIILHILYMFFLNKRLIFEKNTRIRKLSKICILEAATINLKLILKILSFIKQE